MPEPSDDTINVEAEAGIALPCCNPQCALGRYMYSNPKRLRGVHLDALARGGDEGPPASRECREKPVSWGDSPPSVLQSAPEVHVAQHKGQGVTVLRDASCGNSAAEEGRASPGECLVIVARPVPRLERCSKGCMLTPHTACVLARSVPSGKAA